MFNLGTLEFIFVILPATEMHNCDGTWIVVKDNKQLMSMP